MLNLKANQVNEVIIYADTISTPEVTYGDYFLLGFQSTYSKNWAYVIPTTVTRNSRYIKFSFEVSSVDIEEPANAKVWLFAPGNWTYKVWNSFTPTLDPAEGDVIDAGQMYLDTYTPPEIVYTAYERGNNDLANVIYYTDNPTCIIDYFNSVYLVQGDEVSNCNPLYVDVDGTLYITDNSELYIKQPA